MFRKDFAAIALVLTATQAGAEPLTAMRYADFDRYVLALSLGKPDSVRACMTAIATNRKSVACSRTPRIKPTF